MIPGIQEKIYPVITKLNKLVLYMKLFTINLEDPSTVKICMTEAANTNFSPIKLLIKHFYD